MSLAFSLVHFYTLSGQFATQKFVEEHACSFYIDCNKGPGARLIHASVEYTVSDIVSSKDVHPIVHSFFDRGEKSVNYDGHTGPLLSVQVTELIDGIFIGFTMNHTIADGTSFWHYITSLSEIFRQLKDDGENEDECDVIPISRKPILKTLFPDYDYDKILKLPYLEPEEFIFRYDPGPLRQRIFRFSSKSIAMLKAQANEECGNQNNISSFQALCALTWRSITRARNLSFDIDINLSVVMNTRPRINPPLPPEYFRCFFGGALSVSKVGDLLRNGLGHIALLINKSIKMQDDKVIRETAKQVEEMPRINPSGPNSPHYRPYGVTVSGSPRFDMYGPEFVLGKAVAVLAGDANVEDGRVCAKPGRDGGGSVDLEICLNPETMNALEVDEEFMSFTSSM
ncbi:putative acetyltransferase At3g50280 [Silene latifolia]|uniref:putative acetyltransferase At3g50280 n=1 Tax=Silene latifolia TaxID=37657 RepID=UPI003D76E2A2